MASRWLKQMVPSGKQVKKAKTVFGAAKGAGLVDRLTPSRNGDEEEQQEGVGSGTSTRTTRSSCTGSSRRRRSTHWDAKITEKRTYETIAWTSEDGLDNSGVVTFHKLAPRLTRVELSLDISPHGPIEKIGRGKRFTKRAVRADLHRFAPKTVTRAVGERLGGNRPTVLRASVTAAAVGGAVAATVYRALRN